NSRSPPNPASSSSSTPPNPAHPPPNGYNSSPPWPQNRPRTQPCKRTTTHADRGPPTTCPLNPARTTAITGEEHWHGARDSKFMCHLARLGAPPTATPPLGPSP